MKMGEATSKTCAVVVTYNRLEMLKQCVDALQGQTVRCDILVVDNASTDGTREWLERQSGNIPPIFMEKNMGGAGGFNAGIKEAVHSGYEYIWLMDDDTLPYDAALEKLLEADRILSGNYGWLSSVALWTDGKECQMNRPKLLKAFYHDIHHLQHGLVRAEQATFVGLFIREETVREVGLPISEFFIWGDDIEYTRRLAVQYKKPCYVAGQSLVTHAMKSNTGSNIATDDVERLGRYNYAFRNENYLYRQEGIKGFCYYFAKCGKNILCALFQAKDHRLRRAGIVVKQFFLGLLFNPKVETMESSKNE